MKHLKELPPVDLLREMFEIHDETFFRCGKAYVSGLKRKNSRKPLLGDTYCGSPDKLGYLRSTVPGFKGQFYIHRLTYLIHYGELSREDEVDHIDGDVSNNSPYNLRAIPKSLNQMNRFASRKGAKSKYIGVIIVRDTMIRATCSENGKSVHLGTFGTEIEAAKARDEAVARIHGPVARLNRDLFEADFNAQVSLPL
jgi:HNH endonuclease